MLVKFAVTNYRGFSERIEWDLSRPSNYSFNEYAIKDGVIKNGIVYGSNGSGKSNLSFALFDIVNHLSQKMKMADYYVNFAYAGHQILPLPLNILLSLTINYLNTFIPNVLTALC